MRGAVTRPAELGETMTGQEIYETASAFLYEKDNEDAESKNFSVPFLNLLLQECLETENSIRLQKGEEPLKQAPVITSLDETIAYADAITRVALPYGVAAQFFQEALDNFQAENYRAKYIAALNDARKLAFVPIVNVYGGC